MPKHNKPEIMIWNKMNSALNVDRYCYLENVLRLISRMTGQSYESIVSQNFQRGCQYLKMFSKAFALGEPYPATSSLEELDNYEFVRRYESVRKEGGLEELSKFSDTISKIKMDDIEYNENFKAEILPKFGKIGTLNKNLLNELGFTRDKGESSSAIDLIYKDEEKEFIGRVFISKSFRSVPPNLSVGFCVYPENNYENRTRFDLGKVHIAYTFFGIKPFNVPEGQCDPNTLIKLEHYNFFAQTRVFKAFLEAFEK